MHIEFQTFSKTINQSTEQMHTSNPIHRPSSGPSSGPLNALSRSVSATNTSNKSLGCSTIHDGCPALIHRHFRVQ